MAEDTPKPRKRLVPVKAGVIRFDDRGRIIIDAETQAEVGGFQLPPWEGTPGGGGGGTNLGCPVTACQPETVCGDAGCVPEGVCGDAGCVPEGVCGDAGCVPEGVCADAACGDIGCVPEGICADAGCGDVGCVPEGICADGKCVDIFCSERNKDCETNMSCSPGEGPGGTTPGQVETL
jgi:hypothetical protein